MASDEPAVHPFFFHAHNEAKALFQRLDSRFEPYIHLVGFPLESGKGPMVGPKGTPFRPGLLRRASPDGRP